MATRKTSIQAGKKAQVLASMHEAKLPISPGFVIASDAFTHFAKENDLDSLLTQLSSKSGTDRKDLLARIRRKIQEGEFPQSLIQEILSAYIRMGEPRVMLSRSIHEGERIPESSSEERLFGIQGDANLFFAIKKLWTSFFLRGEVCFPLPFAITVQSLPMGKVSVLLFTDDPTSSTKQTCLIKAVYGEGALRDELDGADYYWVKRGSGELYKEVLDRQKQQIFFDHGSEREKQTAVSLQKKRKLTLKQIGLLARIAKDIQQHFYFPQRVRIILSGDSFSIIDHSVLHSSPEQLGFSKKMTPSPATIPTSPHSKTEMRVGMSYTLNPAGHIPPTQHLSGHLLVSPHIFLRQQTGKLTPREQKLLSHGLNHALRFALHHIQSAGIAYDFGHSREEHDQLMVEFATLSLLRTAFPAVSLSLLFPATGAADYKEWVSLCAGVGLVRSSHCHYGLKISTPAPIYSLHEFCSLGLDSVCIDLDAVDGALHGSLPHGQHISESGALEQCMKLASKTASEQGVQLSFASTRTPTRAILTASLTPQPFEWVTSPSLVDRVEHIFEGE